MSRFHVAREDEIASGKVTDVYFLRTVEILRRRGLTSRAMAEVALKDFPAGWTWGICAGVEEVVSLLTGLPVDVDALEEGSVFTPYHPVLTIEGSYVEYAQYETALLGLLCQASGIATKAARCTKAAAGRPVISFGARRMHPALAPMIDRSAFIGGCDGVAVVKSAELIKEDPVGTIPHSLVLLVGDTVEAARAFDELMDPRIRRVALIDTFHDEKGEALRVAQALGTRVHAIRFDTPSSRRGDLLQILREVRWELDYRGFSHIKFFVSGGLDETEILALNPVADAYGVGTAISAAPVVNFALDIVEIEGQPIAKRGKTSGRKLLLSCSSCGATCVVPAGDPPSVCSCGGTWRSLLQPLLRNGTLVRALPPPQEIRRRVLHALERVSL